MMVRRSTASRQAAGEGPHGAIDRHVGRQIRLRRMLLGMTQTRLASMVGVTFQQLHLYERGQNTVPASRLYDLARALAVPVEFFFSGLAGTGDHGASGSASASSAAAAGTDAGLHDDGRSQREIRTIIRLFRRIDGPADRRRLLDWMDELGSDPDAEFSDRDRRR